MDKICESAERPQFGCARVTREMNRKSGDVIAANFYWREMRTFQTEHETCIIEKHVNGVCVTKIMHQNCSSLNPIFIPKENAAMHLQFDYTLAIRNMSQRRIIGRVRLTSLHDTVRR